MYEQDAHFRALMEWPGLYLLHLEEEQHLLHSATATSTEQQHYVPRQQH